MNRLSDTTNGELKMSYSKSNTPSYGYETGYPTYTTATTGQTVTQPLPGQPPLPPMPPPGTLPPLPMFSAMSQLQTWPGPWQWITPQAPAIAQSPRDINNALKANRGNYVRRDRFNHNRNNVYGQRGNFNRNKNRRRFEHGQGGGFDPAGAAYWQGIDWQRNFQGDGVINNMNVQTSGGSSVGGSTEKSDCGEQEVKIVSEVPVKKTKQRKPMSQSYPIRNWNLEDAKTALKVENEYNRTVRAQSLIIKFPDPDLNKDIVREFHPGIQNIHFQSPSGPRYCFIQMAENIDIDKAIEELEKIPFGIGTLKVERKSLRDEDYPQPEEIDPYTLYVGNLPESVNVNEVKSKFPTATRVDVGYAQKMRNTRYAFIRYANVDDSISAYKQAHDLMWDTRSIIVRFRRQRGNTCLPGETKGTGKKVVEKPGGDEGVKEEVGGGKVGDGVKEQSWTSKSPPQASAAEPPPSKNLTPEPDKIEMITAIKEEPQEYDEIDMSYIPMGDDDSDDENDEPDELDDTNDEIDENDNEPDNEDSDHLTDYGLKDKQDDDTNSDEPDNLDHMFSEITNVTGDIEIMSVMHTE